jgi:hypothetical protein
LQGALHGQSVPIPKRAFPQSDASASLWVIKRVATVEGVPKNLKRSRLPVPSAVPEHPVALRIVFPVVSGPDDLAESMGVGREGRDDIATTDEHDRRLFCGVCLSPTRR